MTRRFHARLERLEQITHRPALVMGTIAVHDGEVVGLTHMVPWNAASLDTIRAWAHAPRPGFVLLWVQELSDVGEQELIPIDELAPEARRLVERHTKPGTALHLTS